MNKSEITLTVLFDGTFWIGVFEKVVHNKLYVTKCTFGAEPKDNELYDFILHDYNHLKFNSSLKHKKNEQHSINPKRLQRMVKKQINSNIGTKSQQVLKLQQEENKIIRVTNSKLKKEELNEKKFQIKQRKHLEKHKGR